MRLPRPVLRPIQHVLCACLFVLAVPEGRAQTPVVANRPLPDLARDLLDGTLTRGGAEPDTVLPWRYLPLAVGNAWEYETWFGHARIDIPKDTLVGGQEYVVWDERAFYTDGESYPEYNYRLAVRYDTLTSRAIEGYEGEEYTWYFAPCPLDADFDTNVGCPKREFAVTGTYDGVLDFEPDTTVTGVAVKSYAVELYVDRFAAGFGKALFQEFKAGGYYALRYVRVGGEAFGEEQFPVASEAGGPAADDWRLAVWPNPFRDQLSVALTLGRPQRVTLEVVDVLGRVVARRDLGALPAGRREVALDAGEWGAGTYFVRIEAEDGARSVRAVTRLR